MSIKVEVAVTIGGSSVQSIVGTFEMTVLIIGVTGSIERIQVKATDEAYPFGDELTTMNITYVGLSDGITAFGPIEDGVQRIDEIDITVVSHGEVLNVE